MLNHWAIQYLGKPWVSGAQGPEAYDCWSLVRAVYRDQFNITDLPAFITDATDTAQVQAMFDGNQEFSNWRQIDTPIEGDAVITMNGQRPEHVGIWLAIDGGKILQCVYGAGVVAASVAATRRVIGQHLQFWRRHAG